jgi:insecticidal toxin complex protein TccC
MANTWDVVTFSALHHNTPKVTVISNAGLEVRQSVYYRSESEKKAVSRISLQRYDTAGYLKHSIDARLSQYYLQDPAATIPNQSQVNTLSGAVLQSQNVDAGLRVSFSDVRGLTLWTKDGLGNEQTFEYDKLARVTSIHENIKGKKTVCGERFVYSDNTNKEVNAAGRLLKHYDSAGLREVKSYSVLGNVLNENRQFLANTSDVDWPEDLAERQKLLETESYTTQWNYNGLGETIRQIDAKDNQHSTQYGSVGELLSSDLQLKTGTKQPIITKQTYSAAGQLLEKRLANGVVIQYSYEEKTQRLSRLHSLRLSDNQSLQDLNYCYDPGNILEILDKAQEPGFYANEKTEAISQYRYDSLYQLIEASGIESQQATKERATQHPALLLGNPDASRCVNYTRHYSYDAGGNLYEIQHRGAQSYTQHLTIDSHSNRGIETRDSGPSLVESFDVNGNLLYLNTAQPLQWDSCNQLQQVIQLKRETHSDAEQYRYDANGQRIEKLMQRLAQEQIHTDRVRYLPGLELREHWQTDTQGQNKKTTEQLDITQSDGVRVLHWETGKPNEIENDDLRYTLTDQLGSTQLELNAKGEIINYESYYPYGGTAIWATKNSIETHYQFIRYSGKEQDNTGLYYYGYRYYLPWLGRWLNPDPSGISDGLNLFQMAYSNPITFYDTDGKKPTPTLNQTYPPEIHPELGVVYHPIKEVFGFIDPREGVEVDVQIWQTEVEGQPVRLITGSKRAKRLVIYAHGGFINTEDIIHLTEGIPTITVLGPYGEKAFSSSSLHDQTYAKISHEGITLSSEQASNTFISHTESHSKITGTWIEQAFQNISLRKVETIPYDFRIKHLLEAFAYQVHVSHQTNNPVDIMLLRKKANLTAREIVMEAITLGYEETIFNTCRPSSLPEALLPVYDVAQTIGLAEPIFQSWQQIREWNEIQRFLT